MGKTTIEIELISYDPKDESIIVEMKEEIENIIKEKYGDTLKKIIWSKHISTNIATPDGKFKIGNLYKIKGRREEFYALLIGMFDTSREYGAGALHLSFCISTLKNPSMIEANLGLANSNNEIEVDGYMISPNSILGQLWKDNNLYDYMHREDPLEVEFVKEINPEEFTQFYLKVNY